MVSGAGNLSHCPVHVFCQGAGGDQLQWPQHTDAGWWCRLPPPRVSTAGNDCSLPAPCVLRPCSTLEVSERAVGTQLGSLVAAGMVEESPGGTEGTAPAYRLVQQRRRRGAAGRSRPGGNGGLPSPAGNQQVRALVRGWVCSGGSCQHVADRARVGRRPPASQPHVAAGSAMVALSSAPPTAVLIQHAILAVCHPAGRAAARLCAGHAALPPRAAGFLLGPSALLPGWHGCLPTGPHGRGCRCPAVGRSARPGHARPAAAAAGRGRHAHAGARRRLPPPHAGPLLLRCGARGYAHGTPHSC